VVEPNATGEAPLAGRVALVTGGGRGLGRAIALALAGAGADVAISGRTEAPLKAVGEELAGLGRAAATVVADVTVPGDPDRMVAETVAALGGLDLLVNNSGVMHIGPVLEMADEDFDRVLDTNLRGTFSVCRAAGRRFAEQGSGKIVNVASNLGIVGRPQFAAYCASKAGMIGLTRALALEWARYGVQVNAVAPGLVETDMNAELRDDPEELERVLARLPARRMATAEEVAAMVVHLSLPAADIVTGSVVVIDGGESVA
jgi:NAD(P)-dependent dehydrogenase (short-subunit alcohol dehydrogenase family)